MATLRQFVLVGFACLAAAVPAAPETHADEVVATVLANVAKLKAACPEAKVLSGFTARGSNQIERRLRVGVTAHHTEDDVVRWLNGLFAE